MEKVKVNTGNHGWDPTFFAIVNILDKTYVMPNWIEVPKGTTRDQIELVSDLPIVKKDSQPEKPKTSHKKKSWKVESSKPGKFYDVTFLNGEWDCTCPARTFFRGPCKHIKKLKKTETKKLKAL
jgi:hypothetical protein